MTELADSKTGKQMYEVWADSMKKLGSEVAPWAGLTEDARRSWDALAAQTEEEWMEAVVEASHVPSKAGERTDV